MTPLERYQLDLESDEFIADAAQAEAVDYTQALFDALLQSQKKNNRLIARLKDTLLNSRKTPVKGLYFWGGVGRGKTYIVDAFYENLPLQKKMRSHFHRFMQMVHHELKQLNDVQDPLQIVADRFAEKAVVICLDEFHVSDITDAMLLGGLLQALFDRGVVLVTTSNEHPDQLYWDGLQRQRFLPVIELLKENTQIVNVDTGTDYRLRYLDKAEIFHQPLDEQAERMLMTNFEHIAPDKGEQNQRIEIEGRSIQTIRCADGVVWFEFDAICDGPRGPADYIEIGRLFQTVLIANVPQMDESQNDRAKRLITLVDEFYDRNVKLILTAATSIESLYRGKRLLKPFKRTVSRLIEMQSHDYLARQHLSE